MALQRREQLLSSRHCEERSDEAIHISFVARWIASAFSLSFGGQVAALAMTTESVPYFFTLLASILTDVSSILTENAVFTSNGFSMPR